MTSITTDQGRLNTGIVELLMMLEVIRNRTKSEPYKQALKKAEDVIRAARTAQHSLAEMDLLVKDFAPNVGRCVLKSYKRFNEAPIACDDVQSKLSALLGPV